MNTIKSQELRIGNYIKTPIRAMEDDLVTQEYCKIRSLSEHTAFWEVPMTIEGMTKKSGSHIDELEPIPLTEDILLRCGFKMDSYNRISSNSPIMFMRQPNDNVICFAHNCTHKHIKNLHQLQNLFYSLTGEELILQP